MKSLILALSFLVVGAANAAEVVELEPGLSVHDLGDGLWLHRSDHDWGDGKPITSNGVFVIAADSIAMIDTAWTDDQTGKLIAWAEERFGRPVGYAVSTHWHWDKMGGMAEVNRRGITSYALDLSALAGIENDIAPPLMRFAKSVQLNLGDETVEVYYGGAGHTEDNTVVWLENRKVLIGGCLVKSDNWTSLGYLEDADVPAWGTTLRHLLERYSEARRVVPGHGEPGDLGLIRHTIGLVEKELNK